MPKKWWIDYPWRLIQTNLREIDMADMDAEEYVNQLKSFSATVAMINTSGIIASYPTELPFHFQSQFLTGDGLDKIVAACHKAGIRVIARTDFSKVREPIYEAHPDWAFRTADGRVVSYNGDVHVCVNSPYQQKYALDIMAETVRKLGVDGMFFNMGGFVQRDYSGVYHGICHCANCREKFAAFNDGMELPGPGAPAQSSVDAAQSPGASASRSDDAVRRMYRLFQAQVVREQDKKVYGFLMGINPELCISRIGEEGFYRQESNTALDRALPRWQYDASENTKRVKSSFGAGMISTNTSVDFIDFPARHAAVSPYQQSLRLYQNLAQGGALDYYLIGRLDDHRDKSGFDAVRSVFRFHSEHGDVYRNDLVSNAKIALVKDPEGDSDEYRGWYRALAENHFLFDAPLMARLTAASLAKYEAVILPNCEYISDKLIEMLDGYVKAGGQLVAVYRTGFGDDVFNGRKKRELGRCLGIKRYILDRGDMRGSYIQLEPVKYPSLPDTGLVYLDGSYMYAEYINSAVPSGSLIPPQRFGPPERCYPTVYTEHPGAVYNPYGKGRTLYIPWRPGALFYRQGYASYLAYLRDLLGMLGSTPLETNLPEMAELASHTAGDGSFELFSLVNGTGHFGLSFFAPVRLADVRVTVPSARDVKYVRSLKLDRELEFTRASGGVAILLPVLDQYDAIKIV